MTDVGEILNQTLKASKTIVEWQIKKFCDKKDPLRSLYFMFSNSNWFLELHQMSNGFLSLFLCLETETDYSKWEQKRCILYSVGFKAADGSVFKSLSGKHTFDDDDSVVGKDDFLKLSDVLESKNSVLSKDTLTVFCELCSENVSYVSSIESTETLSNCLKRLYLTEQYYDVKLKVRDRDFRAHKLILAARSPVFACMFEHEMSEKRSSVVEITDCDPDAFYNFLIFIYTGMIGDVSCSSSCNLFKIAEKYGLIDLKDKCSEKMASELSVETVCDIIHVSVVYDQPGLLEIATRYFIDNADKILVTENWLTFLKDNHLFANELLIKTLKSRQKKDT